ncbi:MAG: hypothetical protein K9N11_04310 [Lentisphaeria bacterium]|nr:hypothetical protein [Candidatus Neomarinimicrobiota bacterium]MCF7842057.1 hypothetical protein [Lentisphaeria bacterium]
MILENLTLSQLPVTLKRVLLAMLITLTVGVSLGLSLVFFTTSAHPEGISRHYQGDQPVDELEIPEKYPMPVKELLITTHNHILTFTFIFGILGILIQFVSRLTPSMKQSLGLEPFLSILLTFGSMWGIRFIHSGFVWLMLASSMVMYLSFYLMVVLLVMDLTGETDLKERAG